jgi:hypothetical protein
VVGVSLLVEVLVLVILLPPAVTASIAHGTLVRQRPPDYQCQYFLE